MKLSKRAQVIWMLALLSAFFLAVPFLASAETVVSGNDKASLSLYGQINRAILSANDGDTSNTFFVDNANSSTRFGFKARVQGSQKLSLGGRFEVEYKSNGSTDVSQSGANTGGSNGEAFNLRWADVDLQTTFGKFYLGQGDTATNGTSEVDLSGTTVIGYSSVGDMAGGMYFYDKDANAVSGVTIGDVFSNLDGNSRADRLRYDSPSFSGFKAAFSTFSVDTADGDGQTQAKLALDGAAFWSGQFSDVKVAAALGLTQYPSDATSARKHLVNGSVSAIWQGFNATLAVGSLSLDEDKTSDGRDSSNFLYLKFGYSHQFWEIGDTSMAIDFTQANDIAAKDDKAQAWGLLLNQKLANWSSEIYAGFRFHSLDREGASYDDISAVMVGTRIKF
jgi:hypothetical protein